MTFEQAYKELEDKFRWMVGKDEICYGIKSVFLPNIRPPGPVDYVIVGMEPGLNRMNFETASTKIADGKFKNWGARPQKSTLVFAVWKYLCDKDQTKYYFTDLAHGAMPAGTRGTNNRGKYRRWFPLFEEELGLIAKPDSKIIAIGHTARDFLTRAGIHGYAGMVSHPSGNALSSAGREISGNKERWGNYCRDTEACNTDQFPCGVNKTCAQRKLVFDYMIRFERIRHPDKVGWVAPVRANGSVCCRNLRAGVRRIRIRLSPPSVRCPFVFLDTSRARYLRFDGFVEEVAAEAGVANGCETLIRSLQEVRNCVSNQDEG